MANGRVSPAYFILITCIGSFLNKTHASAIFFLILISYIGGFLSTILASAIIMDSICDFNHLHWRYNSQILESAILMEPICDFNHLHGSVS